jgi:hypothetical protein
MKLHSMSKEGKWDAMAAEITDDVLHEFTAIAKYDGITAAIAERFGGIADSITMDFGGAGEGLRRELLQDLQAIPAVFTGFPESW